MKPYRRKLRKRMTPAEVAFWSMVRKKQLNGVRVLRQFSIDNFIVDFYCPKFKLAIELDGAYHFTEENRIYDDNRTKHLNSLGIKVIRFENYEVFDYPILVLDEVKRCLV